MASKKLNRSLAVSLLSLLVLILLGLFMALPFVFAISNAFKPLDELFVYPPRLFVHSPTLDNFTTLFSLFNDSMVPFSRYLFNTVFITAAGTVGYVLCASLAAFVLAKHQFPLKNLMLQVVILSLMFVPQVTAIPNFITMTRLGWVDSYWSLIVPAIGMPLGLFLMKQFMESMVPDEILESARVDGANILTVFIRVAMPMVKPAWLTLIIFSMQGLWNMNSGVYIITENTKTLSAALTQIAQGGIARTGAASAAAVIMMVVPIAAFIACQSQVVETMSTSGLKG